MKIETENQNQAAAQQAVENHPRGESGVPAQKNGAGIPDSRKDSFELSADLDAEVKKLEAEQARRVASIKEQVAAGGYRVDPHAVAEKMLSGRDEK